MNVAKIAGFILLSFMFAGCVLHSEADIFRSKQIAIMSAILEDDVNKLQKCLGDDLDAIVSLPSETGYDDFGRTAIMWALRSASTNCVEWLLESGADLRRKDYDGRTALMMCAMSYSVPYYTDMVFENCGGSIDERDNYGDTVLAQALMLNRNAEMALWCLNHGADVGIRVYAWGRVAPIAFWALYFGSQEVFLNTIKSKQFDVSETDSKGNSALLFLNPEAEDYEFRFETLLKLGADIKTKGSEGTVITQNMSYLKDNCEERLIFLLKYDYEIKDIEDALLFAKRHDFSKCVKLIEKKLKDERQ